MANILWFDSQPGEIPENVVLIGKEIRWQWENYEPVIDETVHVSVVNPVQWQSILDLEAKTGSNPDDIDSVVELARKYQRAGSNKEYISTSTLANLAEIALKQALALHPNEIRLHLELVEMYLQRYGYSKFESENPYAQKLQDEIDVILAIEPTNPRALELKTFLEQDVAKFEISTPSPTLTKPIATKISSRMPTQLSSTPSATPTIVSGLVTQGNRFSSQAITGIFLLVIGFIVGAIFAGKRQKLS